jgi:nucleoside 2-deoxyribosyltransferase
MKVYIAARYSQKEEMKQVAALLRDKKIEVMSSWLLEPHPPCTTMDQVSEDDLRGYAQRDLEDIEAADVMLLFTVDPLIPTVRGGRHVETGYCTCLKKPIYIVGPRENIFHYLPQVKQYSDIASMLKDLLKEAKLTKTKKGEE